MTGESIVNMFIFGGPLKQIINHSYQWEFQNPKMEVPIPYIRPFLKAYVSAYHHNI